MAETKPWQPLPRALPVLGLAAASATIAWMVWRRSSQKPGHPSLGNGLNPLLQAMSADPPATDARCAPNCGCHSPPPAMVGSINIEVELQQCTNLTEALNVLSQACGQHAVANATVKRTIDILKRYRALLSDVSWVLLHETDVHEISDALSALILADDERNLEIELASPNRQVVELTQAAEALTRVMLTEMLLDDEIVPKPAIVKEMY